MAWLGLAGLLGFAAVAQAADDPLTAKEYKVLLNPAKFQAEPLDTANSFLAKLRDKLAAAGFAPPVENEFKEDEDRIVRFYDSQGTCRLKTQHYSLRERVEGTKHKINLKFRSDSQSTAAGTKVSGNPDEAELEADITPDKLVYSHSATETLPPAKTLETFADMVELFSLKAPHGLPSEGPLSVVGGLSIHELTYDGPKSKLGQNKAEFTLTVWYDGLSPKIVNAEMSFKVEDRDKDGDFTAEVEQRSTLMFDTIRGMTDWVLAESITKTDWVYQSQPNFCN